MDKNNHTTFFQADLNIFIILVGRHTFQRAPLNLKCRDELHKKPYFSQINYTFTKFPVIKGSASRDVEYRRVFNEILTALDNGTRNTIVEVKLNNVVHIVSFVRIVCTVRYCTYCTYYVHDMHGLYRDV